MCFGAAKSFSVQPKPFRCSQNRIRCKGVGGGLHRTESGALFTAFRNAFREGVVTCVVQNGRAPCNPWYASRSIHGLFTEWAQTKLYTGRKFLQECSFCFQRSS